MKRADITQIDLGEVSTLAKELLFKKMHSLSKDMDQIALLDGMRENPFFQEVAEEYMTRQRLAAKVINVRPVKGLLGEPNGKKGGPYYKAARAKAVAQWKDVKAKTKKFAEFSMVNAITALSKEIPGLNNFEITTALVEGGFPFKTDFPLGSVTQCTLQMKKKGLIEKVPKEVPGSHGMKHVDQHFLPRRGKAARAGK